ncbi:hypothetical protein BO70DRAFT_432331 [Aspergillus heteromorphus CBS 117.55]|uniref:Uncharacterized protein n=1 Tax=Aspergillus heteromorphus CBS 117.55 TaxID=1448321 RepID=A0A317V9X8_9EURO|nr:uncharacterized protein BO70DRAFT_432331 [Aspergillus heteromorphus CBS 117.55]PWY69682.1 hypothetical protein BO70DRAFT_432331 [Aspergillus heteromorphus CBS 117.55]
MPTDYHEIEDRIQKAICALKHVHKPNIAQFAREYKVKPRILLYYAMFNFLINGLFQFGQK